MDYEKKYKEARERAKELSKSIIGARYDYIFPELAESDDEKIKSVIRGWIYTQPSSFFNNGISKEEMLDWLEKRKETISDAFKESEQEKKDFVGDGFIQCKADFQDFKENNNYWLEYLGNDNYNVRSDNLLGKTYHITPCQLYTIFKKLTWLEKDAIFLHSDEKKDTKWEDIRIQAAITAMQGMLANPTNIETSTDGPWKGKTKITKLAVIYANELIKELKIGKTFSQGGQRTCNGYEKQLLRTGKLL